MNTSKNLFAEVIKEDDNCKIAHIQNNSDIIISTGSDGKTIKTVILVTASVHNKTKITHFKKVKEIWVDNTDCYTKRITFHTIDNIEVVMLKLIK